MSGVKVWLVGGGPGDAGLLTLRGREVLEKAETVIFDRLAGEGLFRFIPPGAELIDAGKEGGRHTLPQREIEEILVRKARAGRRVVRLKGGDPFLFGRGGEEAEALLSAGIPFEIVPGVSSAIAAPECAGIPVTHRGLASSLHIITGHTKEGGLADINYRALASLGGTLVFLMGAGALRQICERLTEAGMDKGVRAAVIERGATAAQRSVHGTLETLPGAAAAKGIKSPAVIVVGEVAALGERFDWKRYLPLAGRKILVTRPSEKAGKLSGMLRDRGAEVIEMPCIKTEMMETALPEKFGYGWIAFTSAAGVESFFGLMRKAGRDVRGIGAAKLAAIGRATAAALEERGLGVDLIPGVYDGANLGRELAGRAAGEKILLLRAEDGSREITDELKLAMVEFDEMAVYRTIPEKYSFTPSGVDAVLFTSASSVRGLAAACPEVKPAFACCIGEQTAQAAAKAGFAGIRVAVSATLEALISETEECFQ